jgi:hypothetical protein
VATGLNWTRPLSSMQNDRTTIRGWLGYYVGSASLNILMPISLMSCYLASAREGHLDQLFHVFTYLKNHDRSTMVFDDLYPTFGDAKFSECNWTELYPDVCEPMLENMPVPRGKHAVMSCFVNADHAGCKEMRRSHSGIIIYVNRAPILWFSK